MAYGARTPNSVEVLAAKDSVSGLSTYVTSTSGKLDVNASFSASSVAIADGSNSAIKATVASLTNSKALAVEIVDGSGNQITSFGGGTQYTNGSVQATPTGTVALGYDGANVRALKSNSSGVMTINGQETTGVAQVGSPLLIAGVYQSSDSSLSNGQSQALRVNNQGKLWVYSNDNQQITVNDNAGSANFTALNNANTQTTSGMGSAAVGLTGTWVGTVAFEATTDGSNWFAISGRNLSSGNFESSATANGNWLFDIGGFNQIRARCSAYTSGTVVAFVRAGFGSTGGRSAVTSTGALKVDGSSVTQPISGSVGLNAGSNLVGKVGIDQTTNGTTNGVVIKDGSGNNVGNLGVIGESNTFADTFDGVLLYGREAGTGASAVAHSLRTNSSGVLKVDGSSVTQPVSLTSTTITGTVAVTESGTWTVQPGNTANTTPWLTSPAASATTVGTSVKSDPVGLSTTVTSVKASAGMLYGYHIYNPNSVVAWIQFFNLATGSVTLGTTTPFMFLAIPPGGWADSMGDVPIAYSTAISIAATTTSHGSTALSLTVPYNIWYA